MQAVPLAWPWRARGASGEGGEQLAPAVLAPATTDISHATLFRCPSAKGRARRAAGEERAVGPTHLGVAGGLACLERLGRDVCNV